MEEKDESIEELGVTLLTSHPPPLVHWFRSFSVASLVKIVNRAHKTKDLDSDERCVLLLFLTDFICFDSWQFFPSPSENLHLRLCLALSRGWISTIEQISKIYDEKKFHILMRFLDRCAAQLTENQAMSDTFDRILSFGRMRFNLMLREAKAKEIKKEKEQQDEKTKRNDFSKNGSSDTDDKSSIITESMKRISVCCSSNRQHQSDASKISLLDSDSDSSDFDVLKEIRPRQKLNTKDVHLQNKKKKKKKIFSKNSDSDSSSINVSNFTQISATIDEDFSSDDSDFSLPSLAKIFSIDRTDEKNEKIKRERQNGLNLVKRKLEETISSDSDLDIIEEIPNKIKSEVDVDKSPKCAFGLMMNAAKKKFGKTM